MALDDTGETPVAPARHPATVQLLSFFRYDHLSGDLRETSRLCAELAHDLVERLPDGPELTAGLRKLLEAKDCFVRQALVVHLARLDERLGL